MSAELMGYMVKGKHVTAFSNSEERAVGLDKVVPFLLEDKLKERGALYSNGPDFSCYIQVDGLLITGQNPASSGPGAEALLKVLRSNVSTGPTHLRALVQMPPHRSAIHFHWLVFDELCAALG
jgi:putative intracellular protease/amidase